MKLLSATTATTATTAVTSGPTGHRPARRSPVSSRGLAERTISTPPRLVTAEGEVRVVVDRREEQDRDVAGAFALLDVPRGLESVHPGHVRVEQDHGVVLDEQPLQRVLTARDRHQLDRQPFEDGLEREQVLPPVVDREHARGLAHHRPPPAARMPELPDRPRRGAIHEPMRASSSSRSTGLVT